MKNPTRDRLVEAGADAVLGARLHGHGDRADPRGGRRRQRQPVLLLPHQGGPAAGRIGVVPEQPRPGGGRAGLGPGERPDRADLRHPRRLPAGPAGNRLLARLPDRQPRAGARRQPPGGPRAPGDQFHRLADRDRAVPGRSLRPAAGFARPRGAGAVRAHDDGRRGDAGPRLPERRALRRGRHPAPRLLRPPAPRRHRLGRTPARGPGTLAVEAACPNPFPTDVSFHVQARRLGPEGGSS